MEQAQPRSNPLLHGVSLETVLTCLLKKHGWEGLYERIPINCFSWNPSIKSSLVFLRKTPWAKEKVEGLYCYLKPAERATPTPMVKKDKEEIS